MKEPLPFPAVRRKPEIEHMLDCGKDYYSVQLFAALAGAEISICGPWRRRAVDAVAGWDSMVRKIANGAKP